MPEDDLITQLQKKLSDLSDYVDDLWYQFTKKTGSSGNSIYGSLIQSVNYVKNVSGWSLTPDGNLEANAGTFRGALIANSLDIPDTTTANSFHVNTAGDAWWGATTIGSALASILKTGVATFTSISLSGSVSISGIANNTSTDISLLEKTHNLVFSVTNADTIAWTSGTVTLSNGRTFSISSGNTGNMVALTYIYIDPAISSTVLQTTTTAATGMGANKILLGVAQNNTVTASFIPYGPGQPLIDGSNIGALSIVAGNIAASTITAAKLSVAQLSAIAADLGSITTGQINMSSGTANIRSGQTAYNTGVGFFLEYNGGTPRFSIGDGANNYVTWDGSALSVAGIFNLSKSFTADEAITAGDAVVIGDGSTVVTSPGTDDFTESEATNLYVGGSFTASSNTNLFVSMNWDIYGQDGTTRNYTITITLQTDNAGAPSGSILGTLNTSFNGSNGSPTTVTWTPGSPIYIAPSTKYWVVVQSTNSPGGQRPQIATVTATTNKVQVSVAGSSWSAGAHNPQFGYTTATTTAGHIVRSNANVSGRYNNFIGFANASIAQGVSGLVTISGIATNLSGLAVGSLYYLANSAGAIQTSAGANTRKVGIAVSTTQMLITNIW